MPRYEFTDGSSNKFWDIELAGKSFTTTYGKTGANGQTTIKTFKSPAVAKTEYEKLIAEKVRKGYAPADVVRAPNGKRYFERGNEFWEARVSYCTVKMRFGKQGTRGQSTNEGFRTDADTQAGLERFISKKLKEGFTERVGPVVVTSSIEARKNPALEKAILANPDDADAYMVYADWLQDQGDPRGELIALQTGGKKAAAKKLLDQHVDYFLGPLKEHQICYDGFRAEKKAAFHWKNGFIHAVRLAHNQHADNWDGKLAKDVLEPLLKHPSGKFIVELTINENDDPSDDTLDDIFAVIAKRGMPTLRKLRIGDDVSQISWYRVGNLGKLWKAVPNLTHLDIGAGEFALGTIELPNLAHAVFRTGGLSRQSAKAIATAKWPKIEHLEVFYGAKNYGGNCTPKDVAPLLDRTDLPKLAYLAVKDAEFQNELVPHLAKSKLVKQLTTLDISEGILTDDAVPMFLEHADAFKHLVLDVSGTYLSKGALKKLKGVAKQIIAKDIRDDDDPEYRYVWTGE
ncbi:MAG: WGR domain-containing protein [Myxococcota bacterium]|nr:WGR domain-containing protein [Myxococcota bacterium]